MGVRYTIDRAARLVRGYVHGVLTNEDLRDQVARMMADQALRRDYRQLVDLGGITDAQVDEVEIRAAASAHVFDAGSQRAFVASNDVARSFATMFAIYAEEFGHQIRIFRDLAAAEEWLGLRKV